MSRCTAIGACFALMAAQILANQKMGLSSRRMRKFNGHMLHKGLSASSCENVEQFIFEDAVIDNFAPVQEQKLWKGANEGQRYWINKQFWKGDGYPIFVFLGGEGAESCSRLGSRMYLYSMAEEYSALLVDIEHRFYGESWPTVDMDNEHLRYLSSEQALADAARLISYLKDTLPARSSKVVTVGGSYPGNLAAWFRLKYPHITVGSIASSAPVLAQENFPEYMEVVGDAMVYFGGQQCFDSFAKAAEEVQKLVDEGNYKKLATDFKTCAPLRSELDVAILLSDLMGNVQGTVQYNNEHSGVLNVSDICSAVQDGEPYTQFVSLSDTYLTENGEECLDSSYKNSIDYLSNTSNDATMAYRQWYFQTCNEFGYYQTTDSHHQPFHSWRLLDLKFYTDVCVEVFEFDVPPQISWTNDNYGDRAIGATNIAFSSGTIDPWHALGVTNSTGTNVASEVPIYIEGTAHCADLYAASWDDPPSLTNARSTIDALVAQWLQ